MRVPIIPILILACFTDCRIRVPVLFQVLTEIDHYILHSLAYCRCFQDELIVCIFMVCSEKVTRKLRSNRLLQTPCPMGVRHVKSNLIGPEAAGVTLYPEAQHVSDADECERWFYANSNGQGLIREYVQRAIPAPGLLRGFLLGSHTSGECYAWVFRWCTRALPCTASTIARSLRSICADSAAFEMEFGREYHFHRAGGGHAGIRNPVLPIFENFELQLPSVETDHRYTAHDRIRQTYVYAPFLSTLISLEHNPLRRISARPQNWRICPFVVIDRTDLGATIVPSWLPRPHG